MRLIDWIKSKIYKNYVTLEEYEALQIRKDDDLCRYMSSKNSLQRYIKEKDYKIAHLENQIYEGTNNRPHILTADDLHLRRVMAKTKMASASHMYENYAEIKEHVKYELINKLSLEILNEVNITDRTDITDGTVEYTAEVYVGTRGNK